MNFISTDGGKKSFAYETKASICVSQWWEHVYGGQSQKKKEERNYEYISLFQLKDEHWF